MEVIQTGFQGLLVLKPKVFKDDRGFFLESYNQEKYNQLNMSNFVQDNQSVSKKSVLRGLHFQYAPFAQGKLVEVLRGAVLDVAVDLRSDSPTFGKHYKIELNGLSQEQFYIPAGFAHGFVTLEDDTLFSYKCTNFYAPNHEASILWNDQELNIDWQVDNPILSEKDACAKLFSEINFQDVV